MMERIHGESRRELGQLLKLHGMERILATLHQMQLIEPIRGESRRELEHLVKLHGMPRILAALRRMPSHWG